MSIFARGSGGGEEDGEWFLFHPDVVSSEGCDHAVLRIGSES